MFVIELLELVVDAFNVHCVALSLSVLNIYCAATSLCSRYTIRYAASTYSAVNTLYTALSPCPLK